MISLVVVLSRTNLNYLTKCLLKCSVKGVYQLWESVDLAYMLLDFTNILKL